MATHFNYYFFIINCMFYIHVRVKKESDLLKLTFDDEGSGKL